MTSIASNPPLPGSLDEERVAAPSTGADSETLVADAASSQPNSVGETPTRTRSSAILAFLSQGISSATNFLRLVFITRVCTEMQLGDYALGMTLIAWMMAVHDRMIATPYTVFAHRYPPAERGRLLGNTVLASLAATQAASLVIMLVGVAVALTTDGSGIGPMLMVVGLAAPLIVLRELARTAAFTHFRMAMVIAIDVATLIVQASLLGLLWAFDGITVGTIYAAVALSGLFAVGSWLYAWRDEWSIGLSKLRFDWGELWSYSRWLLAARLMGTASRLVIPWVVLAMLGKADAGLLATCASLVGLAWMFVRGINNFFFPYVVKSYNTGGVAAVQRTVGLTALVFTVMLAPLCIASITCGDWLLVTIYGDKLDGSGMVVFVLAVNVLVTAWATATAIGLLALDRPDDNLWIEGLTLFATLAPAPLLISQYGLEGAACAMLAGNAAGALAALYLFLRRAAGLRAEASRA